MTDITVKLTISDLEDGSFLSRVDQSPEGASPGFGYRFRLPDETDDDWYRPFLNSWLDEKQSNIESIERFGRGLYELILDGALKTKLAQCVTRARMNNSKVRLAINLLGSGLYAIPFELLHDGAGFLIDGDYRIVRIHDEFPDRTSPFRPLRRLLVALAEPADQRKWGRDSYRFEIQQVLEDIGGLEPQILTHASRSDLLKALRDNEIGSGHRPFDAVYIVAHAEAQENGDTKFLLESDGTPRKADPLPANELAQAMQGHPGCFVYLNSCSTAAVKGENPFAGAAQRLLRDGKAGAVIAMQRPILKGTALSMAKAFFQDLARGNNPEDAATWAFTGGGSGAERCIPCIYTHIGGPELERKSKIAAFFSADPESSTFDFFIPTFRAGFLEKDYFKLADEGKLQFPECTFNYKGPTLPFSDWDSAWQLIKLLAEMLPSERVGDAIRIRDADELAETSATHIFTFGSRSHKYAQHLISAYSEDFSLTYEEEVWYIEDRITRNIHKIDNPSRYTPGSQEKQAALETDFAIIEKMVDVNKDRVIFVLAGLQDRGTRGAGYHLKEKWEKLVKDHGARPFQLLLKFAPGLGIFGSAVVDRVKTTKAS